MEYPISVKVGTSNNSELSTNSVLIAVGADMGLRRAEVDEDEDEDESFAKIVLKL